LQTVMRVTHKRKQKQYYIEQGSHLHRAMAMTEAAQHLVRRNRNYKIYTMFDIPNVITAGSRSLRNDPHGRMMITEKAYTSRYCENPKFNSGTPRPCNFTNQENIMIHCISVTRSRSKQGTTIFISSTSAYGRLAQSTTVVIGTKEPGRSM
jgi:hypothetical protein